MAIKMVTIDAKTANKKQGTAQGTRPNDELLATSALTLLCAAMGTAALVGIHHRYRKQQQPDASLWDYVAGMRSQLQLINLTSKRELVQFRHACQQAAIAWQQAYRLPIQGKQTPNHNSLADFSAAHPTALVPRSLLGEWRGVYAKKHRFSN